MAFTPSTIVRLCSVPIDITQKNQVRFASVANQTGYFAGTAKHSYTDFTYQRKDSSMLVPAQIDSLWDSNYVMYDNVNYTGRWFYAFIVRMEYVNENCTRIFMEQDVFQTWFLSCTLKACFVEREMIAVDTIGANVINEGLELGEFVQNGTAVQAGLGDMDLILASSLYDEGLQASGMMVGNIYCSAVFYGQHTFSSLAGVKNHLANLNAADKTSAIIALYMAPHLFSKFPSAYSLGSEGQFEDLITVNGPARPASVDGYTPKNKKLLTYPYSFLYAHNNNGAAAAFRWEHFDGTPQFDVIGSPLPSSSYKMFPANLLVGGGEAVLDDYDQGLILQGFPLCSWTYDAYKGWLASNSNQNAIGIAGGTLAIVAGAVTGNVMVAAGGILSVASTLAAMESKSIQPPQAQGALNSGGANCSQKVNDFFLQSKSIRYNQAEILDMFFDMYGYKTNKVKVPNVSGRPYWNYVKTIDCNITGDVPAQDMTALKNIFNSGVTIWHGSNNVADYSLNNH
jgi:hypothetical protein